MGRGDERPLRHCDLLEGLFGADRISTEAGAGARVLVDLAGVQPHILAFDAACPITPLHCPGRVPIGFYVSIEHTS
jgi:hypothetical protein